MSEDVGPLVTVAFPLYRSMRFFDYLVENIEKLSDPNYEILIGDRHLLDPEVLLGVAQHEVQELDDRGPNHLADHAQPTDLAR